MSKQSESSSSSEATRKLWSQVNIPKKKKRPTIVYTVNTGKNHYRHLLQCFGISANLNRPMHVCSPAASK